MKRNLKKILPNNMKPQITYIYSKETQIIFEHKHDVIYHGKCSAKNCVDNYIGETARGVYERTVDHTGRDTNSYLLKDSLESGHTPLKAVDYIFGI